jgi:formate dehydrogenase alpha subunit
LKSISLKINGQELRARPGMTILDVAREAGIEIPTLCFHEELSRVGACRLCVVEVGGGSKLLPACTTPVAEGMEVLTHSERINARRKALLELYLSDHPADCLACEKCGDCRLQDYAYAYGVRTIPSEGERSQRQLDDSNPFFIRDMEKCILCGQCVRMCGEIVGAHAIDFTHRGFQAQVAAAYEMPLQESSCVFCGNCVAVCPTGALIPKGRMGQGRTWEFKTVTTTCTYCGVGCLLDLQVKDDQLVDVSPGDGPANRGKLCVKGRFGLDFIHHPERLTKPLIKKDGRFVESTWDEALDFVARRLLEIKGAHGSDALGVFASAKCTNEENYLLQKFARAVLGTNNVDHCARLCHASTVVGLATAFGSGAMTNSIPEVKLADTILVTGSNTTEAHPVIGYLIKQAAAQGTKLIVADPRRIELAEVADVHLQLLPGTNVALFNGLAHVIIEEGLVDEEFIASRTEGFDALKKALAKYTPEYVQKVTSVPADLIRKAARLYARAERGAIYYSMGITQHSQGTDNVLAIANLAMLTGNVGRPGTGVNPLRGQNNVQGACDMGALPNVLPGYQAVANPELRAKFAQAWGVDLPEKPGMTITEMIPAALSGNIKALYICAENPMVSDPDINHVRKALENLEFLVVQDIFLTETAQLADVVLPGTTFAEKDGTFTNTERRVQRVRQAVSPRGDSRPDWQIICELARRMGYEMAYQDPSAIMDEISSLTPSYGGIDYGRIEEEGLCWPCPTKTHPGTPVLHAERFTRGLGKFTPVEAIGPAELPDDEYPLILTTGRNLYHFHTGSMTRRSEGLDWRLPEGYVEINPGTARDMGIKHGDMVKVASRRGEIEIRACVTPMVPEGIIFIPFHFAESAANVLTNPVLDPVAKIPEFKACAARIEKVASLEEVS